MSSRKTSRLLGWILGLVVIMTGTLAWACPVSHKARRYSHYNNYRVNTPVEYRYDYNHNGWLGPQERIAMAHYRVNTRQERHCDFNRNGYIDTSWERRCY